MNRQLIAPTCRKPTSRTVSSKPLYGLPCQPLYGLPYERNSLIVTTNLPFENWTEVLGSERLTGAALDRLTHRCQILETKGERYRLQDAKRRRKGG